jgi:hypothetical protein
MRLIALRPPLEPHTFSTSSRKQRAVFEHSVDGEHDVMCLGRKHYLSRRLFSNSVPRVRMRIEKWQAVPNPVPNHMRHYIGQIDSSPTESLKYGRNSIEKYVMTFG